ncbi:hypothetical protein O9G_003457 [Rozella allomycis CSF55]|uniref:HTH CENPB-type domain-containing protein n=1 Tax=Rozella allomycis (strain CSF55) TaxID=988480 RepID=A0A075AUK0_ROZAC|nr:hypothetical protein O9G_003457 [Rozella allomycis CSF55]|eukprot:EPZ33938.1 hypothetical protein O9G_003457 [Rozella allomycis CSF55]
MTKYKDVLVIDKFNHGWIQRFCDKHRIVLRTRTGKGQIGQEKRDEIDRSVAYHLGQLNENYIDNMDDTHFIIEFDNGKTLGFYADVVSGGEGMTMVVRITGVPNAKIMPPMMIFTNAHCSHPIKGVPVDIDGACYRSGKKDWMDKRGKINRWIVCWVSGMARRAKGVQKGT